MPSARLRRAVGVALLISVIAPVANAQALDPPALLYREGVSENEPLGPWLPLDGARIEGLGFILGTRAQAKPADGQRRPVSALGARGARRPPRSGQRVRSRRRPASRTPRRRGARSSWRRGASRSGHVHDQARRGHPVQRGHSHLVLGRRLLHRDVHHRSHRRAGPGRRPRAPDRRGAHPARDDRAHAGRRERRDGTARARRPCGRTATSRGSNSRPSTAPRWCAGQSRAAGTGHASRGRASRIPRRRTTSGLRAGPPPWPSTSCRSSRRCSRATDRRPPRYTVTMTGLPQGSEGALVTLRITRGQRCPKMRAKRLRVRVDERLVARFTSGCPRRTRRASATAVASTPTACPSGSRSAAPNSSTGAASRPPRS